VLTRYNRKSVTVVTDDGRQWNVSPGFLNKIVPPQEMTPIDKKLVLLDKR
jgi:hypothetical protein